MKEFKIPSIFNLGLVFVSINGTIIVFLGAMLFPNFLLLITYVAMLIAFISGFLKGNLDAFRSVNEYFRDIK